MGDLVALHASYCARCGEVYLKYLRADDILCVVRPRGARACGGRLEAMPAEDEAVVLAAFALGGWEAIASLGGRFSPPGEVGQATYRPPG